MCLCLCVCLTVYSSVSVHVFVSLCMFDTLLTTIEGRLEGNRGRGRPRRTWVDDLRDWTGSKRYEPIKRAAERRDLHGAFACHSSGCNTEKTHTVVRCDSPSTLVTSTALSPIRSGSWSMMMVRSAPVLLLMRSIERRCQSVQYMYSPARHNEHLWSVGASHRNTYMFKA